MTFVVKIPYDMKDILNEVLCVDMISNGATWSTSAVSDLERPVSDDDDVPDLIDLEGLPDLIDSSGSDSDEYRGGEDEWEISDTEYRIISLDFLGVDSVFKQGGGFSAFTASAAKALDGIGLPKAVLFTIVLQYVGK